MPHLDLHGEDAVMAKILTTEFIEDNYKLGNIELAIIHGVGKGILKKEVHSVLKENKNVLVFGLDNFNSGCTLIKLDKKARDGYNTQRKSEGGIF